MTLCFNEVTVNEGFCLVSQKFYVTIVRVFFFSNERAVLTSSNFFVLIQKLFGIQNYIKKGHYYSISLTATEAVT